VEVVDSSLHQSRTRTRREEQGRASVILMTSKLNPIGPITFPGITRTAITFIPGLLFSDALVLISLFTISLSPRTVLPLSLFLLGNDKRAILSHR